MRMRELRRMQREAFTLIELLVVIAIIAVLVSLTLAAVMNILEQAAGSGATTEMPQMDGAHSTVHAEVRGRLHSQPDQVVPELRQLQFE